MFTIFIKRTSLNLIIVGDKLLWFLQPQIFYFQPSNRKNLRCNHFMSAKIYAKLKNLDTVQWVARNVYSYQSLSKTSKISRINKNRENKYLRYYEYARESTKLSY